MHADCRGLNSSGSGTFSRYTDEARLTRFLSVIGARSRSPSAGRNVVLAHRRPFYCRQRSLFLRRSRDEADRCSNTSNSCVRSILSSSGGSVSRSDVARACCAGASEPWLPRCRSGFGPGTHCTGTGARSSRGAGILAGVRMCPCRCRCFHPLFITSARYKGSRQGTRRLAAGRMLLVEDFAFYEADKPTIDWFLEVLRSQRGQALIAPVPGEFSPTCLVQGIRRRYLQSHDHELHTTAAMTRAIAECFVIREPSRFRIFIVILFRSSRKSPRRRCSSMKSSEKKHALAHMGR